MTKKQIANLREKEAEFQRSLVGKTVKSYGGGRDLVLSVETGRNYEYIYTVKSLETREVRKHGTKLTKRDVV